MGATEMNFEYLSFTFKQGNKTKQKKLCYIYVYQVAVSEKRVQFVEKTTYYFVEKKVFHTKLK
jgi:hypothetical protein